MPNCMPKRMPRFGRLAYKLYAKPDVYAKVYAKPARWAKEAALFQYVAGGFR